MSETHYRERPPAQASAQRRRAQPRRDPPRGRAARDRRGHRRPLDRPSRRRGRDEQERPLRPLRLRRRSSSSRRSRPPSEIFNEQVVEPAASAPTGIERLRSSRDFLRHVEDDVFPGGCFFASVAAELDTRPGPVRDRRDGGRRRWTDLLEAAVRDAQAEGAIDPAGGPRAAGVRARRVSAARERAVRDQPRRRGSRPRARGARPPARRRGSVSVARLDSTWPRS